MSNTPTHYILLREFLAPWARRNGASSPDWQQEIFDDLVESGGRLTYTTDPDSKASDPSIELLGQKFRCGAKNDQRRTDTIFVFSVQTRLSGAPQPKGLSIVSARWQLKRGDGPMHQKADPLTDIPELLRRPAPIEHVQAAPTPELVEALIPILRGWTAAQFLDRVPPPGTIEPRRLLAHMRQKFGADLRRVSSLITDDDRQRAILEGRITPEDAKGIFEVQSCFGLALLDKIRHERSAQLEPSLASLLDLPPPPVAVVHLIHLWLKASLPGEQLARHAATDSWLARGDRSHFPPELWQQTVGRVPRPDAALMQSIGQSSSVEPLLAPSASWTVARSANEVPVVEEETLSREPFSQTIEAQSTHIVTADTALAAVADAPGLPLPLIRLPVDTDTPSPSTPSRAAGNDGAQHNDFVEQMRSRFLALRSSHLIDSQGPLIAATQAIGSFANELSTATGAIHDAAAVAIAREALIHLAESCAQALALLPTAAELARIKADVDLAISRWQARPKLAAARAWIDRVKVWTDVLEIVSLIDDQLVEELPSWFYGQLVPAEAEPSEAILGAIADQGCRFSVRAAVSWFRGLLDQHGEDALLWLWEAQPGEGVSPEERLRVGVLERRDEETLRPQFDALVVRCAPWAKALWESGELAPTDLVHSLKALSDGIDELGRLAPRLADGVREHIHAAVGLLNAHARLRELEESFHKLPQARLAEVPNLNFLTWIVSEFSGAPNVKAKPALEVSPIEIHHCISEKGAVRAAQLVARPDPDEPVLHLVDIPINLRAASSSELHLRLDIEAPYLEGRPERWRDRLKQRVLIVSPEGWFAVEGGQATSVMLRDIPVTATRADRTPLQKLTLSLSGSDETTGLAVKRTELNFDAPLFDLPSFDLAFGDTTSPGEMRNHPLGIQAHFDDLRSTVLEGRSSFLIAAPRRFGKTTFLQALVEDVRDKDVVAIGPITASTHASVSGAFAEACERLGKELDAHVATSWIPRLLPEEDTFDAVRRRAAEQGKRAIYLLFDESQALFAGRRGKEAAELFKARIEKDWGRARDGLVPIRFGLVGQLHLRRLIAGQLDGVFANSRYETEIRPDDIERLLRGTAKGRMQSTSQARKLLASVSRNLLILRFLLRELRTQLIQERRTWFLHTDVQRAFEEQVEEATRGPSTLGRYVLDPLNNDDDLTNWRPIRAFPLALAWAAVLAEGIKGHPARMEKARQILTGWASDFAPRCTISADRIEECLRDLKDVTVLDEANGFRSQLLESYLARLTQSPSPLREPQEWQALQALVVDSIILPERMEPVGQGGQARVFRTDIDARSVSVRVVEMDGDESRKAFIETCYALKAIEGTRSRSPGYQSLPVVRRVGYTKEDLSEGAVIYDWIPGTDLSHKLGQLDEDAVLRIGRPLAEALVVLEHRGVVHRDLQPDNVILDPAGVPVLIDFGLARLLERSPRTRLQPTDFVAPEARSTTPQWTSRADVYALGITLQKLLRRFDASSRLGRIIVAATHDERQARLSSDALVRELLGLAGQLSIDRAKQDQSDQSSAECRKLTIEWARNIAERHVPSMIATALGLFDKLETLRLAAQLLDDLFEEYCRRVPGGPLPLQHLTQLKAHDPKSLPTQLKALQHRESYSAGYLRHGNAHRRAQDENLKRALAELGNPPNKVKQLEQAVLETAQRMEKALGLGQLLGLVKGWVRACHPVAATGPGA